MGVVGDPIFPCGEVDGEEVEFCAEMGAVDSPAGGLGPCGFCFMVKPCHGTQVEGAFVAEGVGYAVYGPGVHEPGVANRSPSDEDGDAGQFVVDHLTKLHGGDGVGFGLTPEGDAHDEFFGFEGDVSGRGEVWLVDGWDGIASRPAGDGDGGGVGDAGVLPGRDGRRRNRWL